MYVPPRPLLLFIARKAATQLVRHRIRAISSGRHRRNVTSPPIIFGKKKRFQVKWLTVDEDHNASKICIPSGTGRGEERGHTRRLHEGEAQAQGRLLTRRAQVRPRRSSPAGLAEGIELERDSGYFCYRSCVPVIGRWVTYSAARNWKVSLEAHLQFLVQRKAWAKR